MAEEGLQEVDTYVYLHQNTVSQFIVTRPIMDLCLTTERITGPQVYRRRWKHDRLDVERMRTAAWDGKLTKGAGGDGQGRDRGRDILCQWEDNIVKLTLEIEPNTPLAYVMGLE